MNMIASPGQLRASQLRWLLFAVPGCLLLGVLAIKISGGQATLWYESLIRPEFFFDEIYLSLFSAGIFTLQGAALAMVGAAWGGDGRGRALTLFGAQFAGSLLWWIFLFGFHQMTLALAVLALTIPAAILTMFQFLKLRFWSGWLMLPAVFWLFLLGIFNFQLWYLNGTEIGSGVQTGVEVEAGPEG